MRRLVHIAICMACLLFVSCNKEQSAINDLENFSEELSQNSAQYSNEEWEEASQQYEQLVEQIDQYEYTDEQLKEIGRLKARCMKQITKGAMRQLKEGLHDFTKQIEGALEEFDDAVADEN